MKIDWELDDKTKTILTVVGLAGGALLIYWYLKSNGYWDQWFGGVAPAVPAPPPGPVPPGQQQAAPQQPDPSNPYVQAVQVMSAAASAPLQSVEQWAQLWQNGPMFQGAPLGFGLAGSITPSVMAGLSAQVNGAQISAAQFVGLMYQQQTAGMSAYPARVGGGGDPNSPWVN